MEKKEIKNIFDVYSQDEKLYLAKELENLRNMRDMLCTLPYVETNSTTYINNYNRNKKADLGYSPPIKNDDFAKLTTGATHEKGSTLLSVLLDLNYQSNITAYDEDKLLIAGLGREMEDLVKKSRDIESYELKRPEIYRELVAIGEVYVEECYVEYRTVKESHSTWDPRKNKISDYKKDTMPIYSIEGRCETKLHPAKYVLTSSMTEVQIQNNECVATYEELDWGQAESKYGNWERFKYVPKKALKSDDISNVMDVLKSKINNDTNAVTASDYDWNLFNSSIHKVGVLKVYKRFENRFMLYLNGVMMLPIDFAMTKICPSGLYPMAKGLGEVIPNFRSGIGMPAKTYVDQKVLDVILRAMVTKTQRGFEPPLGTNSDTEIPRDILAPNKITRGIRQNTFFPILPEILNQVSNAEFGMFEKMQEILNNKTVTDVFAGNEQNRATTATEIINQQKQTMKKLVGYIDGLKNLERQLVMLRIFNIIANYTKCQELEEDVKHVIDGVETLTKAKTKRYQSHTIDTKIGDKKGKKIVNFTGDNTPYPTLREQIKTEDELSKKYGEPTRITLINAEWLRNLRCIWGIDVIASPQNDDNLQLLMFMDNLRGVASLFGVQVFNLTYILERIGIKMREDPDKIFNLDQKLLMEQLSAELSKNNPQLKNPLRQINNANMDKAMQTTA